MKLSKLATDKENRRLKTERTTTKRSGERSNPGRLLTYQIKQEIHNLQSNNQSLSDQIKQMKSEREAEERDSRKYRKLSEAIQEMQGKMDRTQKLI